MVDCGTEEEPGYDVILTGIGSTANCEISPSGVRPRSNSANSGFYDWLEPSLIIIRIISERGNQPMSHPLPLLSALCFCFTFCCLVTACSYIPVASSSTTCNWPWAYMPHDLQCHGDVPNYCSMHIPLHAHTIPCTYHSTYHLAP